MRRGRKPRLDYYDIVEWTEQVLAMLEGIRPTLRQVYYQLVARALIQACDADYDRIGVVLTEARERRDLPPDCLVDRTRRHHEANTGLCVAPWSIIREDLDNIVDGIVEQLTRVARWFGQPVNVHVWVEKDALAGVLEPVCDELGVSLFPVRGDPSFTALHEWVAWLPEYGEPQCERICVAGGHLAWHEYSESHAREHVILYLGDHDPAGLRIPETTFARVQQEIRAQGRDLTVRLDRIALNLDQVREIGMPSFPVKGKRHEDPQRSYLERFGDQCWELDAIPPTQLVAIVREHVGRHFDPAYAGFGHDGREETAARIRAWLQGEP